MTTSEWFTPPDYVAAARNVLGVIDLDPASCEEANQIVRAGAYYDATDDGLAQPWFGRVFLNPPGGKDDTGQSLVKRFWERFSSDPYIEAGIWVGYSLEQLQTLQSGPKTPLNFPICVPRRRIAFVGRGTSPSHGNYITYRGPNAGRFAEIFGQFGQVRL